MRMLLIAGSVALAAIVILGALAQADNELAYEQSPEEMGIPPVATDCIYGKVTTEYGEPIAYQRLFLRRQRCEYTEEDYACQTNKFGWYFISMGADADSFDLDLSSWWTSPATACGWVYYPGYGRVRHDITAACPSCP